jgi:hypothetical protein
MHEITTMIRRPICYNPPAVLSILPITVNRMESYRKLRSAGPGTGFPRICHRRRQLAPEPVTIFVIPVGKWSMERARRLCERPGRSERV